VKRSLLAVCEVCSAGCQSFKRSRLSRLFSKSRCRRQGQTLNVTAFKCNGLVQNNGCRFRLRVLKSHQLRILVRPLNGTTSARPRVSRERVFQRGVTY